MSEYTVMVNGMDMVTMRPSFVHSKLECIDLDFNPEFKGLT